MSVTQIPVAQATTVRQIRNNHKHVETARELIGTFQMDVNTPVGRGQTYMMNPLTLAGTRISKLAQNYQKFRFKRLGMTVQSTASSATGGLYTVGYNSNPDAEVGTGVGALQKVSALPGMTSASAWTTTTVNGKIEDTNKWYNLDADSAEVMQTTQGYFAIICGATPTAPVSYPIWLDYTIEFSGAAINDAPELLGLWPAGTWTRDPADLYSATFVAAPGEPPPPTTVFNRTYTVNPAWPVETTESVAEDINAFIQQAGGAKYRFFASVEDVPLKPISIAASFVTPRSVVGIVP